MAQDLQRFLLASSVLRAVVFLSDASLFAPLVGGGGGGGAKRKARDFNVNEQGVLDTLGEPPGHLSCPGPLAASRVS